MNKKVILIYLFSSILLLGACQKSDNKTMETSEKIASSSIKNSSTTRKSVSESSSKSSSSSQTNEVKTSSDNEPDIINTAREQLVGKRFSMVPSLYDGIYATQAMAENKVPQSLIHDGAVGFNFINDTTVHVELNGTYRPDYDTSYTLTNNLLIIQHRNIPYSINNGQISFDTWTTDDNGHTITWTFGSEKAATGNSTEATSENDVDTKNLTSQQLKDWVGAVLDKQFSMGRSSFPYKLSVENHDGYAYVRVDHSQQQIDTLDIFRINNSGQLEEQDLSNGYPATYKVVSTTFMDTSNVTVMNN